MVGRGSLNAGPCVERLLCAWFACCVGRSSDREALTKPGLSTILRAARRSTFHENVHCASCLRKAWPQLRPQTPCHAMGGRHAKRRPWPHLVLEVIGCLQDAHNLRSCACQILIVLRQQALLEVRKCAREALHWAQAAQAGRPPTFRCAATTGQSSVQLNMEQSSRTRNIRKGRDVGELRRHWGFWKTWGCSLHNQGGKHPFSIWSREMAAKATMPRQWS